jgi:hypothetical protein
MSKTALIAKVIGQQTLRLEVAMHVEIDIQLFDRIEAYLESKLPDPEAAAILQALEAAEVERTTRALKERFIISEPSPNYENDQ